MRNIGVGGFALAASISLSGCGSLYLYDQSTDTTLAATRAQLDQAKTAEVFDRRTAYLDQLEAERIAATTAQSAAIRDQILYQILLGSPAAGDTPKQHGYAVFSDRVSALTKDITGQSDIPPGTILSRQKSESYIDALLSDQTKLVARIQQAYIKFKGKRPGKCEDAIRNGSASSEGSDLDQIYAQLVKSCTALDQQKKELTSTLGDILSTAAKGEVSSRRNLKMLINLRDQQQKIIQTQKAEAEETKKALATAKTSLEHAQSKTESQDALTTLDSKLKSVEKNPYAQRIISENLSKTISTLASSLDPAQTAAPSLTTTPPATASDIVAKTRSAAGMLQAIAKIGDATADPPRVPHPYSLAIAQAQASFVNDVATMEIANAENKLALISAQADAISVALLYLTRARLELDSFSVKDGAGMADFFAADKVNSEDYRHAVAALYFYYLAWNQGLIIADNVEQKRNLLDRRKENAAAKRATQSISDTIAPGLDTLTAYGKGGIDPKTIAAFLGSLGLTATAVGVNK